MFCLLSGDLKREKRRIPSGKMNFDRFESLNNWLKSKENFFLIERVARQVYEHISKQSDDFRLLPAEQDLAGDIVNFLYLRMDTIERIFSLSDERRIVYQLESAYIRHLYDQSIGPEKHRRRYIRKRVRDLVRESSDFVVFSRPLSSIGFSMEETSYSIHPLKLKRLEKTGFSEHLDFVESDAWTVEPGSFVRLASDYWKTHCRINGDIALKVNHRYDFLDWAVIPDSSGDSVPDVYRRTRQFLVDSKDFYTFNIKPLPLMFALKEDADLLTDFLERIFEISFPYDIPGGSLFEDVNHRSVMLALAAYFCNQAAVLFQVDAVWVRLDNFIQWIAGSILLNHPVKNEKNMDKDALESVVDHSSHISSRDMGQIETCARYIAGQLTRQEKAVFYMKAEKKMKLEAIASALGYKGPSGVSYPLAKAGEKIRQAVFDDDNLSCADIRPEFFEELIQALLSILKKSVDLPE